MQSSQSLPTRRVWTERTQDHGKALSAQQLLEKSDPVPGHPSPGGPQRSPSLRKSWLTAFLTSHSLNPGKRRLSRINPFHGDPSAPQGTLQTGREGQRPERPPAAPGTAWPPPPDGHGRKGAAQGSGGVPPPAAPPQLPHLMLLQSPSRASKVREGQSEGTVRRRTPKSRPLASRVGPGHTPSGQH